MDPEVQAIMSFVLDLMPIIAIIVAMGIGGSILNTWLKIKNGYPLQNAWGMALHPKKDEETGERIRLLTTENAQLRAELGSIKDRLETVERIVTDKGLETAEQIEALRKPRLTDNKLQ